MTAGSFDGEIRINTTLETKDFNQSLSKISNSMGTAFSKVLGVVKTIAAIAVIITAVVAAIAAAVVLAAVAIVGFGISLIDTMSQAVNRTSEYGQQIAEIEVLFANVKGAIFAAFSPLIAAALPYIKIVVSWLVNLLNTVSMIVAAMLGQATVMQYVAGSADSAATNTGRLADNTTKAGKAAKGALAAFDELHVLQQESANSSGIGGLGGGSFQFKQVPVENTILKAWQEFKKDWDEFWKDPLGNIWKALVTAAEAAWAWIGQTAQDLLPKIGAWVAQAVDDMVKWINQAWIDIQKTWAVVSQWFYDHVTKPVGDWFLKAWEDIKKWVAEAWLKVVEIWNGAGEWFKTSVIDPISNWFSTTWTNIKQWVSDAWTNIQNIWNSAGEWFRTTVTDPISNWFDTAWTNIKQWISDAWTNIVSVWTKAGNWFQTTVIDPIKTAFKSVTDWLGTTWETTFTGIKDFVKGTINTIIDFLNTMIRAIVGGINSAIGALNSISVTIPDWVPLIGGQQWGLHIPAVSAPQIPRLASGAVIPPNAAYLALLGDQRSGRNIEAPENLIRQIIREEIGAGNNGNMTVTMPVYLDGRKIYENQKRIEWLRGDNLIEGYQPG
jgi:hypothetical protein